MRISIIRAFLIESKEKFYQLASLLLTDGIKYLVIPGPVTRSWRNLLSTTLGLAFSLLLDAGPVEAEIYVDQVLEQSDQAAADIMDAADLMDTDRGRSLLGGELTFYRQSGSDQPTGWEQGVGITWSRETVNYGIISVDAGGRYQSGHLRNNEKATHETLLLRQDNLPLRGGWDISLAAGDHLSRPNPLLANSYRLKLSSSLIRGASATLASSTSRITLSSGEVGNLNGFQTRGFVTRSGWLTAVDYERQIDSKLKLAVNLSNLTGSEETPDHSSLAGAMEFSDKERDQHHQFHWLVDDRGAAGGWVDGKQRRGRWLHRYGLFRLEPALLWTDQQVGADRQGGYWQGDFRSFRKFLSLGWDYQQNNLDKEASLTTTEVHNLFARYSYQARRRLSIGGVASANLQNFSEAGNGYKDQYALELFSRYKTRIGTANLRLKQQTEESDSGDSDRLSLSWDQEWSNFRVNRLRTNLTIGRENLVTDQLRETTLGILYDRRLGQNTRLDADLIFGQRSSNNADDTNTVDTNLGLLWQITPALSLRTNLNWSRNQSNPQAGSTRENDQRRLFVTLQYSSSSGSAPRLLGRQSDTGGAGRITGTLFFDEDRDGIRSPGEQTASNVQLILDGRFRRSSDQNGDFEFWPVHGGEHQITIAEELLPLPWVVSEQVEQKVIVNPRRETRLEIPLVRITE
ncbi:MAG TPA: hypothetical protein DCF45_03055 [Gammaproteobacteria bacterium]|nr:hypothetical protein [Gammaproteobacteria bacterium]